MSAVPDGRFDPFQVFGVYRTLLANNLLLLLLVGNLFWSMAWIGTVTYLGAYTMFSLGASQAGVGVLFSVGACRSLSAIDPPSTCSSWRSRG